MLKEIPKATPNNNPFHENVQQDKLAKPKSERIRDLGFSPKQTAQFQQMADHEELVHEAIEEARENDDINR